jgi:hypothetical protein
MSPAIEMCRINKLPTVLPQSGTASRRLESAARANYEGRERNESKEAKQRRCQVEATPSNRVVISSCGEEENEGACKSVQKRKSSANMRTYLNLQDRGPFERSLPARAKVLAAAIK